MLESMLPAPLPISSRFMFDRRPHGSSLSIAAAVRSDSRLATNTYITMYRIETSVWILEKSGVVNQVENEWGRPRTR